MQKDKKNFLAKNFKALADENRLKVLCVIYDKKRVCVSEIAEKLKQSVAIVSHHLHALAKAGLVAPKRDGKRICYLLLNTSFSNDLKKLVCKYK
jgi:DNA-binding transcriptional ArsR family regulator